MPKGEAHVQLRETRMTWCGLPIIFGEWVFPSSRVAKLIAAAPPGMGLVDKRPCAYCLAMIAKADG